MKRLNTLFLLISILAANAITAQTISAEDLNLMQGIWDGYLYYTDYQDDQSQVSLKTKLTVEVSNGSARLNFDYTEPNGKIVSSKSKMKYIDTEYFSYGGKNKIVEQMKNDSSWKLVTETTGKDNNRSSLIRYEINVSSDTLNLRKLVKYDGTDVFFQRNSHTFTK